MTVEVDSLHAVLLFDGVCNLCNGAVNFVIDRDPQGYFHFAALQSPAGEALLRAHGVTPSAREPDSMFLLEHGVLYDRSTAALRIAQRLTGGWKMLAIFLWMPRVVRDAVYRFVARHRYRWFGRQEVCRVPSPELRARFVAEPG